MGEEGFGIGKYHGYTLFMKDAIPGDFVEALILKGKKTYGYAKQQEKVPKLLLKKAFLAIHILTLHDVLKYNALIQMLILLGNLGIYWWIIGTYSWSN